MASFSSTSSPPSTVSACWRAMAARSIAAPPTGVNVSRQSTPISIGPMIEKAWMRGSPGRTSPRSCARLDQRRRAGSTPFSTTSSCQTLASSGKLRDSPTTIFTTAPDRERSVDQLGEARQQHPHQAGERQVERQRSSARSPRYWGSRVLRPRRGRCRSWSRNRDRACPWRRRRAPRSPRSARRRSPSRRTRAAPRRRCRSAAPPCAGAISERRLHSRLC